MRVLFAGGHGFLGQKIVSDLAGAGHKVTIAGRRNPEEVSGSGIGLGYKFKYPDLRRAIKSLLS